MIRTATFLIALTIGTATAAEPGGANWQLAQKFNREFVGQHLQPASVFPQWIGKTEQFWYAIRTADGTKYWRVDPAKKTKLPLFDEGKFIPQLAEAAKRPIDAATLSLGQTVVVEDGSKMTFTVGDFKYEYVFATEKLTKSGKAQTGPFQPSPEMLARMTEDQRRQFEELRRQRDNTQQQQQQQDQQQQGGATPPPAAQSLTYKNISPDKKRYAFVKGHDLYLADEGKEDAATRLTTDGAEEYSFAGGGFGGGFGNRGVTTTPTPADRKSRANVTWSTDSKYFYVSRTDGRNVKELFLVDSIALPRPNLEKYKYPMPGEEAIRKTELFYCDAEKKALTKIKPKFKDERYSGISWGKTPGELRIIRRDRLQRNLEVCRIDATTGAEKCLFAEGFEAAFLDSQPLRYVEETDELLWWSERSGWAHLYRYGRDGTFKGAITAGNWRVDQVLDVDGKNKIIYFRGNGREAGENVYFQHLYRVNFDGTGLVSLTPGAANHTGYLSPGKKFVVDNESATDKAPAAVLRDDNGREIMELERTDLSRLQATGWKLPEPFAVKAADGVTDLYGNMWKPFDFDPTKRYPIIAHVYPGPQTEGVTHTFSAYSTNMQLAQLGFVVIQVGHRGGSPERSKAYHSFGYFNLRDYGLIDKKAAIEALAAKHAYIDLKRVGIYGHSGGGFMSAAALLQPPYNDFFTAAVASAGNHDNNIYNDNWSERYHGMKEVAVGDTTQTGTGTGTGTTGTGTGRRRPPTADEVQGEIDAALAELNPDDKQSVAEVEKKLAELEKKLADLKKTDAGTKTEEKKDDKKVEEKKTEEKKAEEKKMKFEIKVPTNAELAANLKGHLMLVHGEVDNNVHPANTMRLVDALIKANKRFDLLIIPGARHGFGVAQPYFTRRMWDFFSEHLLDDRPTAADINEAGKKK